MRPFKYQRSKHGRFAFVELPGEGERLAPPQVWGVYKSGPYTVTLELSPKGGALVVSRVQVLGDRMTLTDLREINVNGMADDLRKRHAPNLAAMILRGREADDSDPDRQRTLEWLADMAEEELSQWAVRGPRTTRRNEQPREHFEKVAKLYREATELGLPQRRYIIDQIGWRVPPARSTVSKWIRKCRDLGLIPEREEER